ncbi:MAG: hypothetical protein MRZ79_23225 [Bacteroidia bacterium]|nr:hypothetical protein [Bacteroidia bacterium]
MYIYLFIASLLCSTSVFGQNASPWSEIDPDCFYLNLSNYWTGEDGKTYSCPILPNTADNSFSLERRFFIKDSLTDDLLLWVGRYAWEMEVLLNGHYLEIGQRPFNELFLPLQKEWLNKGENTLVLKLVYVKPFRFCPIPTLGIWDGIGLIKSERKGNFKAPQSRTWIPQKDTVALIAPFYGKKGHKFDEELAARLLLPLLKHRINKVYFWFEPDRNLLAMTKRMGLYRVESLNNEQKVCAINYYPYQPSAFGKSNRFWLDSLGNRTRYYGEIESWQVHRKQEINPKNHFWLVFLALLPFLNLALIKLASPAFFASMENIWLGGIGRNDGGGENLAGSNALNLMLNFIRLLSHASFLSLALFFLQHLNLWNLTSNLFSEESLFTLVFGGGNTLGNLYMKMLSILGIWQGAKWVALWILGSVFGQKQMPGKGFSFEVISDFPLILFLPIPWLIGVYTIDDGGTRVVNFMIVLFGIYFLRKLILLYSELSRTFNFSPGMKVLYICTLNVLPYLIWL